MDLQPPTSEKEYVSPSIPPSVISRKHRIPLVVWSLLFAFVVFFFIAWRLTAAPAGFTPDTTINVHSGWSVSDIAQQLQSQKVIASARVFRVAILFEGGDRNIPAGVYRFPRAENVFGVARHFVNEHGGTTVKVTFPEGTTAKEMGTIGAKNLPQFDELSFEQLTRSDEGFLFPDTYFFYDTATSGEVYIALKENFTNKTQSLHAEAETSGRSWRDTIILASLVEEEATTPEDRRLVAGILLHRIQLGMYLGVDATFAYTLGKGSSEITGDDLRSDDPYNTYRHKGLPPGPIANPGLDAIEAALHPIISPYLYYLSDKQGKMHYARTFDEHKANKLKYLSH